MSGLCFWMQAAGGQVTWKHLSSKNGDLPVPGASTEQTSALVADVDKDGTNDFVLTFRQKPPAAVWYRKMGAAWQRYIIEEQLLTVEAGGAAYDIDGDGDLDLVFGGDWQSNELWWWENPCPKFEPGASWKRHLIKKGGAKQHHDQIIGYFEDTQKPQLVFWNQGAKTLFLAEMPVDAARLVQWPVTAIFSGRAGEGSPQETPYAEGLGACDIDGDGKVDLLAGNCWFKHISGQKFKAIQVSKHGGCVLGGKFKAGPYAQVVISPGDGVGPLTWHECKGKPENPEAWETHELLPKVVHGHSLQLGDIDGDGNLDIFCAEMAKWGRGKEPENPNAKAWIFYGDGKGSFRKTELVTGNGWHEARLVDLDGDGTLDILNKPYTWDAPRVDIWLNQRLKTK